MILSVSIEGSVGKILEHEALAGERAVSSAMRTAGASLKTALRADVTGAGLGNRLANTIRSTVYPAGQPSLNAAALVWSKAPKIVGAHERGALIRSRSGFWLAIPTAAAGRGRRGGRITPGEWEKRNGRRLRLVYRPGRAGLLVDDGTLLARPTGRLTKGAFGPKLPRRFRNRTVPVFILVPQVKLAKQFDLASRARAAHAALPGQIVAAWRGARAQ